MVIVKIFSEKKLTQVFRGETIRDVKCDVLAALDKLQEKGK